MYYQLLHVHELLVNILRFEWSEILSCVHPENLATRSKSEKRVPSIFIENILLSKTSRKLSLPSKRACKFLRISFFLLWILRFYFTLEIHNFN